MRRTFTVEFFSLLNILNLSTGIFAIATAILILHNNARKGLNQLFFLTFFLWSLNIFFYSIARVTLLGEIGVWTFRRVNASCGIAAGFMMYLTGRFVHKGKEGTIKWQILTIIGILACLMMILASLDETVTIVGPDVNFEAGIVGVLATFLIPGVFAAIGVWYLYVAYSSFQDPLMRARVRRFMGGTSLLIAGAVVFGVMNLIDILTDNVLIAAIAEICWATGPIFILVGLRLKSP